MWLGGGTGGDLCRLRSDTRSGAWFASLDGTQRTDELAMNPQHFRKHTPRFTCSIIVHEMAHKWQHHFGKPTRPGYHDREWAAKMRMLGLYPSSTGAPGGKETGYKVSHYIIDGGPFDQSFHRFEAQTVGWGDADVRGEEARKPKRFKFVCTTCEQNVWGIPGSEVSCARCHPGPLMEVVMPKRAES
jgi:predicted SprT family Zn-dependent metalloprotease